MLSNAVNMTASDVDVLKAADYSHGNPHSPALDLLKLDDLVLLHELHRVVLSIVLVLAVPAATKNVEARSCKKLSTNDKFNVSLGTSAISSFRNQFKLYSYFRKLSHLYASVLASKKPKQGLDAAEGAHTERPDQVEVRQLHLLLRRHGSER